MLAYRELRVCGGGWRCGIVKPRAERTLWFWSSHCLAARKKHTRPSSRGLWVFFPIAAAFRGVTDRKSQIAAW